MSADCMPGAHPTDAVLNLPDSSPAGTACAPPFRLCCLSWLLIGGSDLTEPEARPEAGIQEAWDGAQTMD